MDAKINIPEDKRPDFCLAIDFARDSKNPGRVFKSMAALIEAMEGLDSILIESIDSKIKPVLLLDSVESGSIKVWLKQFIELIPDDSLNKLDWKPIIGQYLVRAKHFLLSKVDPAAPLPNRESIEEISAGINEIARSTNVKLLPVYKKIPAADIAHGIKMVTDATSRLSPEDSVMFYSDDGDASIPSAVTIEQSQINEVLSHEIIENRAIKILMVRRPDFLGDAAWEFRHEDKRYPARIDDIAWLDEFRDGRHDIRPGDALKVEVREVTSYDQNGEVVSDTRSITKIIGVIRQHRLSLIE